MTPRMWRHTANVVTITGLAGLYVCVGGLSWRYVAACGIGVLIALVNFTDGHASGRAIAERWTK